MLMLQPPRRPLPVPLFRSLILLRLSRHRLALKSPSSRRRWLRLVLTDLHLVSCVCCLFTPPPPPPPHGSRLTTWRDGTGSPWPCPFPGRHSCSCGSRLRVCSCLSMVSITPPPSPPSPVSPALPPSPLSRNAWLAVLALLGGGDAGGDSATVASGGGRAVRVPGPAMLSTS